MLNLVIKSTKKINKIVVIKNVNDELYKSLSLYYNQGIFTHNEIINLNYPLTDFYDLFDYNIDPESDVIEPLESLQQFLHQFVEGIHIERFLKNYLNLNFLKGYKIIKSCDDFMIVDFYSHDKQKLSD